ncbi:hypothetical protein ASD65_16225 [Microbacterium sp. Root61]|uniref:hypothetical protein n=1 Tax=Microbacterium sp. Root61 TaxID=1736570 RepID=UPI0006FE6530|nr:hypothetical protein [Microbacterium sp. Root61]KRA25798.1 hypothetical protein ASD65_16225 [Microbacterium sp. Root61]
MDTPDTFDTTPTLEIPDAATTWSTAPVVPEPLPRPRIRWAAVIWGIVLGAIAAGAFWIVIDPDRGAAVGDWLTSLTALSTVSYSILAIGGLALVTGLVGLARRAQRHAEASAR